MKIVVELDRVCKEDETPLIISHPTGVFYSGQCGGMSCRHPEFEGYVIGIGDFGQDFDTCQFGCLYMDDEDKIKLSDAFDELCKETEKWIYKIKVDRDRLNEMMEGWIPVIINGKMDSVVFENTKGIIHLPNCD